MFDFVRKYTKVIAIPMFLLIILAFILVGVDGYTGFGNGGATVATVGSHSIKEAEWEAAHKSEVDQLRNSMPNLDPKLLDSAEARYVTLERLVRDRVLTEAAISAHLNTSDARLARELQQNPTIAALRRPDGTLDIERYRQLAASQGLSPEGFEARVRNNLTLRQLESGLLGTSFSAPSVADVSLNAFFEKREVQIVSFSAKDFASKVSPTDAELEAFYQSNQALFQAPESASIEYAVLDLDAVKKTIMVNEEDLKSYYEQNVARLSSKEERRASHILISAPKDMAAADRQKAKDRAQALLAQVRKAPNAFAEVAKKNSQDPGSAASGGDLDFFARGAMVKPFEDAAFALKKGDISDVVESDFGFHIIKLTDIKAAKQPSYEELRANLEAELKAQQAQRKFAEVAELFTNGVYEQSDSLKAVAERLKLEVKTASNLQRNPSEGSKGILNNPKFLAALFTADSIEKKRNTEAVETASNQLTSGRITQYTPARTLPLAEVRGAVRERLVASRSAELAKKEGAERLAAWIADSAAAAKLPAPVLVSREPGQPIQGPVLDAALSADPAALPAWVGVDQGALGYAVLRVNKVLPRTPVPEGTTKQERAQYAQWYASAEKDAYYQLLKDRFKVQIKVPRPSSRNLEATAQ
jgi:peptidyl-prolyl cis-trans isomerase D